MRARAASFTKSGTQHLFSCRQERANKRANPEPQALIASQKLLPHLVTCLCPPLEASQGEMLGAILKG